jgi:hypothetical protein
MYVFRCLLKEKNFLMKTHFSRIVETINSLKTVLRPYWCCLQQLNDTNQALSLNDYLERFDEIRKTIKFYDVNNPPEEFPLFGFHPFMNEDEAKAINEEVDELIKNTDLTFAPKRTCLCTDEKMMEHHHLLDS